MLRSVLDVFWDEAVWLPPNTTWADVNPGPDKEVTYTDHWDAWLSIPMALLLMALRFVLHKCIFVPLGKSLGIKHTRKKAYPNHKLEAAYQAGAGLDSRKIVALSKQLDLSQRQIERWWRHRRLQDKPPTLVKFCESAWRTAFLLYNLVLGLFVLWGKPWLWDVDHCFIGYPHQGISNDMWWYYMSAFAFNWSQTFSLQFDVRRKDHRQMVTHHATSLLLLYLSWVCNAHRTGSLVLLVGDSSEMLLEATKTIRYANYEKTSICMFVVFTSVWILTRITFYPYIIWSIPTRGQLYVRGFPMAYILLSLLLLLLALNLYWTWLILQVAYRAAMFGETKKDIRSSSSEISDNSVSSEESRKK
ncbi:ceramide synthase 6-like [Leguminivora glycinivorella]|uniref:ceramide synthase 6-like n=1 Tax=Leguminivora glycinivorella TaxID=1035111 RepID=UPI00200FDC7D|nr:ceramide synthase 6-like [Leguminivora glycinivorella]